VSAYPACQRSRTPEGAEVDILDVAFVLEPWRGEAHHVHAGRAAIEREFAYQRGLSNLVRDVLDVSVMTWIPACAANAPGLYEGGAVKGYFGGD
jgi:hypothetical protein